jgi:hypothetical protein
MLENRSVPPDTILPHVEYQDLAAAVAWLTKTFGFIDTIVTANQLPGAQLTFAMPGSCCPTSGVDNIDVTLAQVAAHGGLIVASPRSDSRGNAPWIASFRDAAGQPTGPPSGRPTRWHSVA